VEVEKSKISKVATVESKTSDKKKIKTRDK